MQAQTSTDSNGNEIQAPVPVVQTGQRAVADIIATAQRAIRGNSAVSDDAEVFVSSVRANFRLPERPGMSDHPGKQGRQKSIFWKCAIFLLRRSVVDFFPSTPECKVLQEHGFGLPSIHNGGTVLLKRSWTWDGRIASLYPALPLQLVGLTYKKCDKGKRLVDLGVSSVYQIQRSIGRGKLVVLPKREIPLQPQVVQRPVQVEDLSVDQLSTSSASSIRVMDDDDEEIVENMPQNAVPVLAEEIQVNSCPHVVRDMILDARLQNSPGLQLPPLDVEAMSRVQLAEFIPHLVTLSTGRTQPAFDKLQLKPSWWPEKIPWAKPSEQPQQTGKPEGGTESLKEIVRSCYKYMRQERLLTTSTHPMFSRETQDLGQKAQEYTMAQEDCSEEEDSAVWICFICAKEFKDQDSLEAHQDLCEDESLIDVDILPLAPQVSQTMLDTTDDMLNVADYTLEPDCHLKSMFKSSDPRPVPTLLTKVVNGTSDTEKSLMVMNMVVPTPFEEKKSSLRKRRKVRADIYIQPNPELFFASLDLGPTPKVEKIAKTPRRNIDDECNVIDLTIEETPQTPRTSRSLMSQLSRDEGSTRKRQLSFSQVSPLPAVKVKQEVLTDSESNDSITASKSVVVTKGVGECKSSLMTIDLSSPLGQRLKKHWNERQLSVVTEVEKCCATSVDSAQSPGKTEISDKLRSRNSDYPVSFKFTKKYLNKHKHLYKFNKRHRIEFHKRLETGLDRRSRRLLKLVMPCSVIIKRLNEKTIKLWTTRVERRQNQVTAASVRQFVQGGNNFAHMRYKQNKSLLSESRDELRHHIPPRSVNTANCLAKSYPVLSNNLKFLLQQRVNAQNTTVNGPFPQLLVRPIASKEGGPANMRLEVVSILNHRDPSAFIQLTPKPTLPAASSPKKEITGSQKRKQVFENVRADDEISIISLSSSDDEDNLSFNKFCQECKHCPCIAPGKCKKLIRKRMGPASFMRRLSEKTVDQNYAKQLSTTRASFPASFYPVRSSPSCPPMLQKSHFDTKLKIVGGKVVNYTSGNCNSTSDSRTSVSHSVSEKQSSPVLVHIKSSSSVTGPPKQSSITVEQTQPGIVNVVMPLSNSAAVSLAKSNSVHVSKSQPISSNTEHSQQAKTTTPNVSGLGSSEAVYVCVSQPEPAGTKAGTNSKSKTPLILHSEPNSPDGTDTFCPKILSVYSLNTRANKSPRKEAAPKMISILPKTSAVSDTEFCDYEVIMIDSDDE